MSQGGAKHASKGKSSAPAFQAPTKVSESQPPEARRSTRSNRSNPSNLSRMDNAAGPVSLRGLKCPLPLYFKKDRSAKVNKDTDLDGLKVNWIKTNQLRHGGSFGFDLDGVVYSVDIKDANSLEQMFAFLKALYRRGDLNNAAPQPKRKLQRENATIFNKEDERVFQNLVAAQSQPPPATTVETVPDSPVQQAQQSQSPPSHLKSLFNEESDNDHNSDKEKGGYGIDQDESPRAFFETSSHSQAPSREGSMSPPPSPTITKRKSKTRPYASVCDNEIIQFSPTKPASKRKPEPSSFLTRDGKRTRTSDDTEEDDLSETDDGSKPKKKGSTKITEDDLKATKIAGIVKLAKEGKREELLNSMKVSAFPREDDVDILERLRCHLLALPSTTPIEISHKQDLLTTFNVLVKTKDPKLSMLETNYPIGHFRGKAKGDARSTVAKFFGLDHGAPDQVSAKALWYSKDYRYSSKGVSYQDQTCPKAPLPWSSDLIVDVIRIMLNLKLNPLVRSYLKEQITAPLSLIVLAETIIGSIVDEYILTPTRKQHFTDDPYGRKYRARLKAYNALQDTEQGAQYLMVVAHTIWSCVQLGDPEPDAIEEDVDLQFLMEQAHLMACEEGIILEDD